MLSKIRGLSSEKRNSSLPFHRPRMYGSGSVITSPEGKGRSKVASLERKTKEWRDGRDSVAAMESEGGTHPTGQGCAEQAALEDTSFWKPQVLWYGIKAGGKSFTSSKFIDTCVTCHMSIGDKTQAFGFIMCLMYYLLASFSINIKWRLSWSLWDAAANLSYAG